MTREPFSDPRSVEMAIKSAATSGFAADPTVSIPERLRQAHFDRLLCRVFSQGERAEWVLKGGTGLLARIPAARSTKDIDLFISGYTLDEALASLRELASVDLGDHFRFEYASHRVTVDGDQQPYAVGYRVTFQVFLGTKRYGDIAVDLVQSVGDGRMPRYSIQTTC